MSPDPYGPRVRELFAHPEHGGDLAGAVVAEVADQGVQVRLAMQHVDGEIRALRFRAWGCPHLIAACEAFCATWEGRPIADLGRFEAGEIMGILSIPVEKTGRILVLEDTVRSLGRSIRDGAVTQ